MLKILFILLVSVGGGFLAGSLLQNEIFSDSVLAALFTVAGIMFTMGLSVLLSNYFQIVKNRVFYERMKSNALSARKNSIVLFVICSIVYIASNVEFSIPYFGFKFFCAVLLILSIIIFAFTFLALQDKSINLQERLNKEEKEKVEARERAILIRQMEMTD